MFARREHRVLEMDNNMSKIIEGKMDFRSKLVMKLEVRDQRAAWCSSVAAYILLG